MCIGIARPAVCPPFREDGDEWGAEANYSGMSSRSPLPFDDGQFESKYPAGPPSANVPVTASQVPATVAMPESP